MTPILEEIVGYLNFSSGVSDPKFLRNINSLFRVLSQKSSTTDSLTKFAEYVGQTTARLRPRAVRSPTRRKPRRCCEF